MARAVPQQGTSWSDAQAGAAPQDEAELAQDPRPTLTRLLFPGPYEEFGTSRQNYGDLSVLPTVDYLYGLLHGGEHLVELRSEVQLHLGLEATGEPDERGLRTVVTTMTVSSARCRCVTTRWRWTSRWPNGPTLATRITWPRRSPGC